MKKKKQLQEDIIQLRIKALIWLFKWNGYVEFDYCKRTYYCGVILTRILVQSKGMKFRRINT